MELPQEYIEPNDDGKYLIKFKGKSYGPFMMIAGFFKSADNTSFAAVTTDENMNFSLVTSEGINQKLNGTFERLIESPTGNHYLLMVKEGATINMAAVSSMSEEEMMKYMQEFAQQQQNAGEPQMQIFGNGGKLLGKYPASKLSSDNPAFCQTGGDNWYMILDNNLYINGNLVRSGDNSLYHNPCKIWISADGKRYAINDYSKILFSDGNSYPPPIQLKVEKSGTKTILKWIALENETDLVSYSKEL
jgi:hypothetical protein